MKKALVASLLLVLLFFASCSTTIEETENQQETSMFVQIERTGYWKVVYHKETKVLYAVSDGSYNRGNFTVLVNPDGTPMLWKGDRENG